MNITATKMDNIINYETALYTYMKRVYGKDYKLDFDVDPFIKSLSRLLLAKHNYTEIRYFSLKYLSHNIKNTNKKYIKLEEYERLFQLWDNDIYSYLFIAALQLISFKNTICTDINKFVLETKSTEKPLSLKYDNISVTSVYMKRAVTLRFINIHITNKYNSDTFFKYVVDTLKNHSINIYNSYYPIINESLKQSTTSKGGSNYEDLIEKYLLDIGVDKYLNKIQRFNHDDVGSLENDFKFLYNGRKYGISAKKTLRERYKQYVNLIEKNTDIDIFLTITLGTDLTEDKAKIIRSFGVYIFVSPEIYNSHQYLQDIDGIYNIFDLNLDLLTSLK
ncbi:hypothetical protein ACQR2L_05050 [Clostridium butyricum]|uniref:hypothetical protein n=1 Tax=Clostridium butyricum TaxID=1492 RepID=UPI003D0CE8F1